MRLFELIVDNSIYTFLTKKFNLRSSVHAYSTAFFRILKELRSHFELEWLELGGVCNDCSYKSFSGSFVDFFELLGQNDRMNQLLFIT